MSTAPQLTYWNHTGILLGQCITTEIIVMKKKNNYKNIHLLLVVKFV